MAMLVSGSVSNIAHEIHEAAFKKLRDLLDIEKTKSLIC